MSHVYKYQSSVRSAEPLLVIWNTGFSKRIGPLAILRADENVWNEVASASGGRYEVIVEQQDQ